MNNIIFTALDWVLAIIEYAIIARALISWFPIPKDHPLIRLLYQLTEPVLAPVRGLLERSTFGKNMMFDISPIIAILLVGIVRNVLHYVLVRLI